MMPYEEFEENGKFMLRNVKTGKVTAFSTAGKRMRSKRAREAFAHGYKPGRAWVKEHSRKGRRVKKHVRRVNKKVVKRTMRLPIVEDAYVEERGDSRRSDWRQRDPFWDLYDKDYPIVRREDS